jgi:hypothetical protein
MSKARDLANAGTALGTVDATELGYLDGVTSAVQTQINAKEATLPSQTGNSGKYLTTDGSAKSWGTVSQYALPSQTGNSGKYLTTNGTAESWGTVTTPVTFTQLNFVSGQISGARCIQSNGSNIIVVAGVSGQLMSSTDSGATFTVRTSGFSTDFINDIAFGNGVFVAVGNAGKISSSSDGITWTARTAGVAANAIAAVTYDNGTFVAVGDGASGGTGGITTSTDGTTWTKRTTPGTSSTSLYSVAYGNGYWVAVGTNSTNSGYYSTDLATWSKLSVSITGDGRFVKYNGSTGWYMFQSGGTGAWVTGTVPTGTWYSAGNMPTLVTPNTTGHQPAVGTYNGKVYYILSSNNQLIQPMSETYGTYTATTKVGILYQPILANNNVSALTVDGNKIIIGDDAARIYSATLT